MKGPATLVSREPGELATIYLEQEIVVIGKLETAADAVINIPTVSRIHAKIRKRGGILSGRSELQKWDICKWADSENWRRTSTER